MYVLLIHTCDDAAIDCLSIEELQVCLGVYVCFAAVWVTDCTQSRARAMVSHFPITNTPSTNTQWVCFSPLPTALPHSHTHTARTEEDPLRDRVKLLHRDYFSLCVSARGRISSLTASRKYLSERLHPEAVWTFWLSF